MKSTVLRAVLTSSLLASSFLLGGQAYAKTLVYCSEANPETFNPAIGTADSTMDAAAKTSSTGWSSSSLARPRSGRRWPKAGRSQPTARSTRSTYATA